MVKIIKKSISPRSITLHLGTVTNVTQSWPSTESHAISDLQSMRHNGGTVPR